MAVNLLGTAAVVRAPCRSCGRRTGASSRSRRRSAIGPSPTPPPTAPASSAWWASPAPSRPSYGARSASRCSRRAACRPRSSTSGTTGTSRRPTWPSATRPTSPRGGVRPGAAGGLGIPGPPPPPPPPPLGAPHRAPARPHPRPLPPHHRPPRARLDWGGGRGVRPLWPGSRGASGGGGGLPRSPAGRRRGGRGRARRPPCWWSRTTSRSRSRWSRAWSGRASPSLGWRPARRAGAGRDADLVLLDLGLPDLDGREVCRRLRARTGVPIIVVTARSDELDRVLLLEMGADDYVVKPFGFRELVARIRAVQRRTGGGARVDRGPGAGPAGDRSGARRVWLAGEELDLTPKEFDLLGYLAEEPSRVRTRRTSSPGCGTSTGGARPRPSTSTWRRCAASSTTTTGGSPRCGASATGWTRRSELVVRRLLATYLTITAFVLAVVVVPLGLVFADREHDRLVFDIERDAQAVASLVEDALGGRHRAVDRGVLADYADTGGRIVVVDSEGVSVADSDRPGRRPARLLDPPRDRGGARRPAHLGHPGLRDRRHGAVVRGGAGGVRGGRARRRAGHLPHLGGRRPGVVHVAAARGPVRGRARRGRTGGDGARPQRHPAGAPPGGCRPRSWRAATWRRGSRPATARPSCVPGGDVQPHGRPPGPAGRLATAVRRRRLPPAAHPADRPAPPPGDPRDPTSRRPPDRSCRRRWPRPTGWPAWSSRCWCWPAAMPPPPRSASWTCRPIAAERAASWRAGGPRARRGGDRRRTPARPRCAPRWVRSSRSSTTSCPTPWTWPRRAPRSRSASSRPRPGSSCTSPTRARHAAGGARARLRALLAAPGATGEGSASASPSWTSSPVPAAARHGSIRGPVGRPRRRRPAEVAPGAGERGHGTAGREP